MIAEELAGKRVAITGTTGFLGTAVVERFLRQVPDAHLVLLIRPGRRGAPDRVEREILRHDCFDRLRDELGADTFAARAAANITPIAGDVGLDGLGLDDAGRAALAACDIVIHSAATVSFDNPLDLAVQVNLLGPVRVVETLRELGVRPHLVTVSTCYVAGSRRGEAPEELLTRSPYYVKVDWRTEVEVAGAQRATLEHDSRMPAKLNEFRASARKELGAAGTPAIAAKLEQLRQRWVEDQMVEAGRARAGSLGFPDAYAYSKALAEEAVEEIHGDIPLSVVRPSIIESAHRQPSAGWIRGFRMAEPIIVSYGRGILRDFPGVPEGIVDIIPVDMVAAAIIAVAAAGPSDDGTTAVYQVASGSVNPLRYRTLHDTVQEWFGEHPLYDEKDQPISPQAWSYPGRGRVERQLRRAKRGLDLAEGVLHRLPIRGTQAQFAATLEENSELVERAIGYVQLYGSYAECEAIYGVERLLALWDSLDDVDRAAFPFDPRVIDWEAYVLAHLPSVMAQARVKTAPSKKVGESRSDRLRRQVLDPKRTLAAFDLENTLIASNVVASFGWLATHRLPDEDRLRLVLRTLMEGPSLLALDRRDRSDFLRSFYRRYEGASIDQLRDDSQEMFSELILAKSFPAGLRRVRDHRAAGHRTVLITGALDFVVEPLRPLFDDIVSASLEPAGDGTYTGRMESVPPTGETRSMVLRAYAAAENLSLEEAVAYADSTSDLPMLEAVGFPVAVNPETKLASLARRRGWLVENWSKAPGAPAKLLPISRKPAAV